MRQRIEYRRTRDLPMDQVVGLYRANGWSSAEKPEQLMAALVGSDCVVSALEGEMLVGLGNAISDGHLVVYYPHLIVHPDYQRCGIGAALAREFVASYKGFHQHVLVADGDAIEFYRKLGFTRAGRTESMWIYAGADH